jgi:hypothetical protein
MRGERWWVHGSTVRHARQNPCWTMTKENASTTRPLFPPHYKHRLLMYNALQWSWRLHWSLTLLILVEECFNATTRGIVSLVVGSRWNLLAKNDRIWPA